jgi:hypothetical protein
MGLDDWDVLWNIGGCRQRVYEVMNFTRRILVINHIHMSINL